MKTQTSLLIIYLTTSGLVSGAAFAEDKSLSVEGEPLVPVAFLSEPVVNKIELGIGYVADDAYKFGRYNGLQTKGAFVLGDIKAREFYEDGRFWSMRGTNLGLESRYLRLEGGSQGSYKLFLEYDELPNYKNNTVKTPFIGVGGDSLALPSGFDINNNLDASLNSFELKTKRERIAVGASLYQNSNGSSMSTSAMKTNRVLTPPARPFRRAVTRSLAIPKQRYCQNPSTTTLTSSTRPCVMQAIAVSSTSATRCPYSTMPITR